MNRKLTYIMWGVIILLMALSMLSCDTPKGETTGDISLSARKFEFEGNHYILFSMPRSSSYSGITLDPEYLFTSDTITYEGERYVKIK